MSFENVRMETRKMVGFVLLPILALAIADSVLLMEVHYRAIAQGGLYRSFCTFSRTVDCTAVVFTPYSHILGLPIAVLGLVTYVTLTAFLVRGLFGSPVAYSRALALLFFSAVASFGYSVYLAYVSSFVIKIHCVLCYGLHCLNTLLLIAISILIRRARVGIVETVRWEIQSIRENRKVAVGLAVLIVFSMAGAYVLRNVRRDRLIETDVNLSVIFDGTGQRTAFPVGDCPTWGPQDAPIEIVEFNDFECPFCRRSVRTLDKICRKYTGKIRRVFVNFPADRSCNRAVEGTLHKGACRLALAGEAFYRQGKFWEFHRKAFNHYGDWDLDEDIYKIADDLGISREKIREHLEDPALGTRIQADAERGYNLLLQGTPSFLVNGFLVEGNVGDWAWERILRVELERMEDRPPTIPAADGSERPARTESEFATARLLMRNTDLQHVFKGSEGGVMEPFKNVPTRGAEDPVLDIRAFMDFQSPLSREAAHTIETLMAKYPEEVRLTFVDWPIDRKCNPAAAAGLYPGSCNLAHIGRVFYLGGKFWEFYEYAFRHEGEWNGEEIRGFAETLGITQEYIDGNINQPWVTNSVQSEMVWAESLGFIGSPSFVVNGVCLRCDIPLEAWEAILQMEKGRRDAARAGDVPGSEPEIRD